MKPQKKSGEFALTLYPSRTAIVDAPVNSKNWSLDAKHLLGGPEKVT
jgi:hypothetical protein